MENRYANRQMAGWYGRGILPAVLLLLLPVFWFANLSVAHADIDNTARAVGVFNGNAVFSSPSSASIPVIPANPVLGASKTGVLNDDDGTPGLSAGDTISYTITVTNAGNVSLTGISVSDPLVALTFVGGDADNDFRLDVTEVWTYTGSYTISSFDLATNGLGDGDIDNTVTVDSNESPQVTASEETLIDPAVSMVVAKSGVLNDDDGTPGLSDGDTISYTITVENNGTADLTGVSITDTLEQSGLSVNLTPLFVGGDANSDTIINAGEVWTYTASYIVSQANIDDGGNIVNTASVTTDQIGPRNGVDTQVLGGFVDVFTMTKLASLVDGDGDSLADAGETINYTFRFTNIGNRSLANLRPVDGLAGLSAILCPNDIDNDGDIDVLAPGQTLECTATYTVIGTDVTNGSVENNATSTATRINGVVPVAEDDSANDNSTMTPTDSNFELDVDKTVVSAVEILPNIVEIEYVVEITNLAGVTQTGVLAQDDIAAAVSAPAILNGDASIVGISGFSGSGGSNPGFNGTSDTELLLGDVQLNPLATGEIRIRALFDRRGQTLNTSNTAFATSNQISGNVLSDDPGATPGDPNDVNPTTETSTDTDSDGALDDNESPITDRDGDGIPDAADYDPTGYFYCEEDGRILSGGLITVVNLTAGGSQTGVGSSNDIVILEDGSTGFYQFYVTAPGTYRLTYSLPAGGVASTVTPSLGALDATSLLPDNPGVLGSGETGATGVLADFSSPANPFYTDFVIEAGDPTIFNNNIPLMLCGTPSVSLNKEVAVAPVVQGDGSSTLTYRLTVENTGATRFDAVLVTDDLAATFGAGNFSLVNTSIETAPAGFGATLDPFYDGAGNTSLLTTGGNLEPGETLSILVEVNTTVAPGTYTNTMSASGESPADGSPVPAVTTSVPVTINAPAATDGVVAVKSTPVDFAPLGGLVPYTITLENTSALPVLNAEFVDQLPAGFSYVAGSATIDGVPVEPAIEGFDLVWAGQNIPAGATVTLQLQTVLGAGVNGTEFTNLGFVRDPLTGDLLSNQARAIVRLEIESVFQCSHIIGRVFDDLDKDGYHDTGEPGLGGVRIASVNGLLITTDQYGRYHVACDAIPDNRIGSNYILKLDDRTLPTGYTITSENPRVVRVTQGKVVRLNFAAANLRTVSLALSDGSFKTGSTSLAPDSLRDIARILPLLEAEPSILRISYEGNGSNDLISEQRLEAVRRLVEDAWKARNRPYPLRVEIR